MKRFSAQYTITNTGPILKRAVITINDDGTITSVDDTKGSLKEHYSVEFYNGIIIPGFVNCHCHLELSHLKGKIEPGGGLGDFIQHIRSIRENETDSKSISIALADKYMYDEGVNLCADICNTPDSFSIKKASLVTYKNLLEVFGIDPEKAGKRINEASVLAEIAEEMDLPYSIVPHSVYSVSIPLFRLIREKSGNNPITSIHFMETEGEKEFLESQSGPIMESYKKSGLIPASMYNSENHVDAILKEVTLNGNLLLVHNLHADRTTIRRIKVRKNLFWCLCPGSNLYIENKIPPVDLFIEEACDIVIGTDSLASNNKLSILDEIKTLQLHFPSLSIEDLINWATVNGARALGEEENFGKIKEGSKPGLLLLQNVDLVNMKLLPDSHLLRLA